MPGGGSVIFVLFGALVVALIAYSVWAAAQRRKALAAWAAARGLVFDPDHNNAFDDFFPEFDCLHRGRSRYAYNICSGVLDGRETIAFDYHYKTGSGKNTHTHNFSGAIVQSPVPLRPLLIRPEGFFDKVGGFFGADDIDFESAEFSREFFVKSPDRRWAYDVLHARAIEFLMRSPRFSIRFDAARAIVWRDETLQPHEFDEAITVLRGLLDGLPEYVVRQQTGRG